MTSSAATESRVDPDRPARTATAPAPAEKPERETSAPAEAQPASSDKPVQTDAAKASETAERPEASDEASTDDAAPTDSATETAIADAAAALAKPVLPLPVLLQPVAAVLPVAGVAAETLDVLNAASPAQVPIEIDSAAAGTGAEPKSVMPAIATPTSESLAASNATAPVAPFTLEPEASTTSQAASQNASKPVPAADKQIAAALPLASETPQPMAPQAVVQSAAVQAAAEPVVAPTARQTDKSVTTAVEGSTPVVADLGADDAGDVITVSVDDAPAADKIVQPRLTPAAGTAARGGETASSILTPTSGYAAQIAAQDSTAQSTDATQAGIGTPEAKTPVAASQPDVSPQSLELKADAENPATSQTNTNNPLFAVEQTLVRSAQAASDASAASQATRSVAAHPVVEQVTVRVARAMADSVDRIRIQLNPVELGHIDVRMEIGPDGRFNAVFAADRPQTVEMLQRDARELARSLQDAGLRTDAGSLSFNLRGEGRASEQNTWRGAGNSPATVLADTANDTMPAAVTYTNSSAASGRVDIRV